jgi:hypothetical protein
MNVFRIIQGLRLIPICSTALSAVYADAPMDQDVPVAPLVARDYHGWTNAYYLQHANMHVVLVPELGRIMHLGGYETNNLLRVNAEWEGAVANRETRATSWPNYGGDWIWPVAQPHWASFHQRSWPPHPDLDGGTWTTRAWRSADGASHARMERAFGEPFHIHITRTLRLDATQSVFTVRQRIEQTGESKIPFTLWHISQMDKAEMVFVPVDAHSSFEPTGLIALMHAYPSNEISRCEDVAVYDARMGGEHKFGSDSQRSWIAAVKGPWILLVRIANEEQEGDTYPDGGCVLQIFSSGGLGYSEIETMSPERVLATGETIENTLTYSLHERPDTLTEPCALAAFIKALAGEPISDTTVR